MTEMKEFKRMERLETLRRWEGYEFEGPIKGLIEELQKCQKEAADKGWFGVHIELDHYYEDITFYIRAWRQETDKEFNKRWEDHKHHLDKKRRRQQRSAELAQKKLQKTEAEEREMYEQLKRKFG
jgi:hypothetical protein